MATVFIEKEDRTEEVEASTAKELCKRLGINIEEVLVVKDGVLVTEEDSIADAERVELRSVISGG